MLELYTNLNNGNDYDQVIMFGTAWMKLFSESLTLIDSIFIDSNFGSNASHAKLAYKIC